MSVDAEKLSSAKGLVRSGSITMLASVIGALTNLAMVMVIGNHYGPADTGVFFTVIGAFLVLGNAGKLGADTGLVRMLSRERALQRPERLFPTALSATVPVLAGGLVMAGLIFVACGVLPASVFPAGEAGRAVIRSLALFLPLFSLLGVWMAGCRGLGRVWPFVAVMNILLPLSRLVGVLIAVWLGSAVAQAIGNWAFGLVLLLPLAAVLLLRGLLTAGPAHRRTDEVRGEFWRFSAPRAVAAMLEVCLEWLDVILVAALAGPAAAGVYGVATRCVRMSAMVDYASRVAVSTRISAALATQRLDRAADLYRFMTRLNMLCVWPFLIVLAVFPRQVLSLFGDEFGTGGHLVVLTVGFFAASAAGSVQSLLLLGGLSASQMFNKAAALVVCLIGNLLLTPRFGAVGAAWVCVVMMLTDTALATWQVRSRMGVPISPEPLLRMGSVIAAGFGLPLVLLSFAVPSTLPGAAGASIASAALLVVALVKSGEWARLRGHDPAQDRLEWAPS